MRTQRGDHAELRGRRIASGSAARRLLRIVGTEKHRKRALRAKRGDYAALWNAVGASRLRGCPLRWSLCNPSVTAYAVPPFHSSTWSPRFVRKAHLRCSLFHWAYYGLFPPLAAAFVRPFSLREKGGFWMVLLHAIVPLPKRLPFRKKGAVGVSRLRDSPLRCQRS